MLSRRQFLGAAGGLAGAAAAGGGSWAAFLRDSVEQSATPASTTTTTVGATTTTTTTLAPTTTIPAVPKTLVVVQMAGGNDGLNTLVPASGFYRDARPILGIPQDDLLEMTKSDYSMHPALAPLMGWWDLGSMTAVEGVGIPGQSRSHFKSTDTWMAGADSATSKTGWLGRWLDATQGAEPDPLRAIALGGGAPMLVGESSLATVIRSAEAFQLRTPEGVDSEGLIAAFLATSSPVSGDPALAAAQRSVPATVNAVDLLSGAINPGVPDGGVAGSDTVASFAAAARVIDLGIGTQVITIGLRGYDTHSNQLIRQSELLAELADGISVFLDQIETDGHSDDVLLMTMSEFGRRVGENGSGGTDHGQGGLQFLFGRDVNGWDVHGELDLANQVNGDVPTKVDERSVYAEVLDWLGGPTDEILGQSFERIGVLSA